MSKLYWEDFHVGPFREFGPRILTRDEMIAFAREFDPQPMHLDEEAAKSTMLAGLSASGWLLCSILMRMIADGFILDAASMGAPGVDEVNWTKPVRAGDALIVRATVRETRVSKSRPEMGFVRFFYEMFNQHSERVMTLESVAMMERRRRAEHARASAGEVGA